MKYIHFSIHTIVHELLQVISFIGHDQITYFSFLYPKNTENITWKIHINIQWIQCTFTLGLSGCHSYAKPFLTLASFILFSTVHVLNWGHVWLGSAFPFPRMCHCLGVLRNSSSNAAERLVSFLCQGWSLFADISLPTYKDNMSFQQ